MKIDWKKKTDKPEILGGGGRICSPRDYCIRVSEQTATQITGIIMSGATLIAYIIGEGLVDSKSAGGDGK